MPDLVRIGKNVGMKDKEKLEKYKGFWFNTHTLDGMVRGYILRDCPNCNGEKEPNDLLCKVCLKKHGGSILLAVREVLQKRGVSFPKSNLVIVSDEKSHGEKWSIALQGAETWFEDRNFEDRRGAVIIAGDILKKNKLEEEKISPAMVTQAVRKVLKEISVKEYELEFNEYLRIAKENDDMNLSPYKSALNLCKKFNIYGENGKCLQVKKMEAAIHMIRGTYKTKC